MTAADISAGLRLCRLAGWNQTARDWEHFMAMAPQGALVAVDRAVVGTVATVPYGPFCWISMVLVDPAVRGKGIGTTLLERGLALVPEGAAARLDATPAGEVLYRKLGFVAERGLARFFLDPKERRVEHAAGAARPFGQADWPHVREMDVRAFGASRAALLERLAGEAPEYAWLVERQGRLDGYLFGRHGHDRDSLGPLVAQDVDAACALLDACLSANPGRAVFIDVPDEQHVFRAALAQRGFAIERTLLRMFRGILTAPGEPSRIYAIAGPELG